MALISFVREVAIPNLYLSLIRAWNSRLINIHTQSELKFSRRDEYFLESFSHAARAIRHVLR